MYPPFSEFINFVFSSDDEKASIDAANKFYQKLMSALKAIGFSGTSFKPCAAPMYMINSKYRYHFVLKTPYKKDIYNLINDIYRSFNKNKVTISIDVNPNSMH